ncbi:protein kinase STUNTED-like isoform X1 [Apium graveolens]|uniref:protein kinase STUNTED-like isoform X1 n=2 Tax=Apium graveolens TaxID=4045 RepID=UPI003D7A31AF
MTVEDFSRRNVLVGIRFDEHARELLDWAILKVADEGDCVTALHVCQDSDTEKKNSLNDYLNDYEGLCNEKKINLTGVVLKGSSIRKVLVREAKNRAAMTLIVGITKPHTIGRRTSLAKFCAGKLPLTTGVVAVHNGKVMFRRFSTSKLPRFGDPRPSFNFSITPSCKDAESEFDESEAPSTLTESDWTKDEQVCSCDMHRKSLSSLSISSDFPQQIAGWPLLRAVSKIRPPVHETREMSVVQWVMNLPSRSSPGTPGSNSSLDSTSSEIFLGRGSSNLANKSESNGSLKEIYELPEAIEILKTNSCGCRWFSYEVLKTSTSQYSSDCIIGKGGCNSVYKGTLPEGKTVAVKLLKSSKEAWKDFSQEVDIMTFLDHKNITPLLGVCVEENNLISVYDYMARGNLEDNLHSTNTNESVLSWEVRYDVALGIAEALNHIHNECPQPVIHRDVKSSNILLTEDYKPMLSDFGLAIWGPTNSSFQTHTDVLGTFGYLAPEYFMYGKVSDKIDVYSFGVVLLELLSGKRAIAFESLKSPESLVKWAKPILESGDVFSILDSNLGNNFDKDQVELMAFAAVLCLTRAARLRPNMSQVLRILRGEKDVETQSENQNDYDNQSSNDDEVYQESIAESHLSLVILDLDKDATSLCSNPEESTMHSLNDYLKGTCNN